jgi:hypothetical protein
MGGKRTLYKRREMNLIRSWPEIRAFRFAVTLLKAF